MGWENIVVDFTFGSFRWKEFRNREANASECIARILGVAAACFFGDAEAVSRYHHLHIAFQLDNRKQADCDSYCPRVPALNKLTGKTSSYAIRNAGNVRNVVAAVTGMTQSCIKTDRLRNLNLGTWICLRRRKNPVNVVANIFRCKYLYAAFASVKNAFFCKYA